MSLPNKTSVTPEDIKLIDEKLSNRFISLDPSGYFLISLDRTTGELVVDHFTNDIDDLGRAVDPDTGEPLACSSGLTRKPQATYRAKTAKQMGVRLTEGDGPSPLSRLDHALYLGRELQRAEACLMTNLPYVQD